MKGELPLSNLHRLLTVPVITSDIQDAILHYVLNDIPAPQSWEEFEDMMLVFWTKNEFERASRHPNLTDATTKVLMWVETDPLTTAWFKTTPLYAFIDEERSRAAL